MRGAGSTQLSRITHSLRQQIIDGVLSQGQKLPSERELSELFSTTRITLKEALIVLETEGLIYREERRGWFVSPDYIVYNPLSRCHFDQMIHDQHRRATTRVIDTRTEMAHGEYAKALAIQHITPIHIIERLRSIDGRAVLFVENVLKAALFPDILQCDVSQSLTMLYREKYGYKTCRSVFEVAPTSAPIHVAKALNLAAGQHVLRIFRLNYQHGGQLLDAEFEYWRPDALIIRIDSDM
ncbi:UTRA domain-containing protein [Plesiomonas sp.]|uniref:UTRA domain-containing protein n=1 Tax=Plesiomonas sp. TaxID=2486279 RepID=UPI003F2C14AB